MATINFKKSISDPVAKDIGNETIQNRLVSKTLQFGMYTTNENAVWAASQHLQKESYPFAKMTLIVNRNQFRLEVGDVFVLNYSKYNISGMVCRVLLKEEENLESEKITLHVMEDIFSVAKAVTDYSDPVDSSGNPPDYDTVAFTIYGIFEAPYALSETIQIVPLAAREVATDLGMVVHMSLDNGSSFLRIDTKSNIQPYGTLVEAYPLTNPIDDSDEGLLIDFSTTDVSNIESISWSETLSGVNNMGILGDELISFQNITPVSGTQYRLTNIIRSRYGTCQDDYSIGQSFWFVNKSCGMVSHSELISGANRDFKLVPYNIKYTGDLADAAQIDHDVLGIAKTPYKVVNFCGNGVSFAARYSDDVILTWSARKRGIGAGIGSPGTVLSDDEQEGLFDIQVWVSSVLVRTETDITGLTWTYTEAMNLTDNGSLASEIEFKINNHQEELGTTFTSENTSLIIKLSF